MLGILKIKERKYVLNLPNVGYKTEMVGYLDVEIFRACHALGH